MSRWLEVEKAHTIACRDGTTKLCWIISSREDCNRLIGRGERMGTMTTGWDATPSMWHFHPSASWRNSSICWSRLMCPILWKTSVSSCSMYLVSTRSMAQASCQFVSIYQERTTLMISWFFVTQLWRILQIGPSFRLNSTWWLRCIAVCIPILFLVSILFLICVTWKQPAITTYLNPTSCQSPRWLASRVQVRWSPTLLAVITHLQHCPPISE